MKQENLPGALALRQHDWECEVHGTLGCMMHTCWQALIMLHDLHIQ